FPLTQPLRSTVIAIAVLIRGIDLFRHFDYDKVMPDSGPGSATETLTSYAGRIYFNGDFPYASTLSLITLVLVIIASTLFMKIFRVKL
ncbi:MAG: sugar ABC transporter permease, partial [Parvibaculaceae bacterium]